MPIEVSTVYTKELLLKSARYVTTFKKALWVIIGVCLVAATSGCILLAVVGELEDSQLFSTGFVWLLALLEFATYWFVPVLNVKKAVNLDMVLQYSFEEEQFSLSAAGSVGEETAVYRYDKFLRVDCKKDTLFLFFAPRNAFLVDLTQMPQAQKILLRDALANALPPKKVKWKL